MSHVIGLLVIGIVLLLLEVVLPGGVIGIIGLLFLLGGVAVAYTHSVELGLYLTLGLLLLAPFALWAWIHYFPRSRFAKPLTLATDTRDWHGPNGDNLAHLNAVGTTATDLRPSGIVTIDGKRVDVVSDGRLIDRGTTVRVIAVEGNRIIVAPEPSALSPVPTDAGFIQPPY